MLSIKVIPHDSPVKTVWTVVVLLATLIFSLVISYRLTFRAIEHVDVFYWLLVAIYGMDILFNFRFGVKRKLQVISSHREVGANYLRTWFFVDLAAFLPPDGILAAFHENLGPNSPWYGVVFFFQALTLIKLVKVPFLMRQVRDALGINPTVMRLVSFMFWFSIEAHLVALGWVLIGASDRALSNADQYIRALYWAITTIVTIGYGDYYPSHDSNQQIVYTICVQIIGAGIFSYIIGNVAGLLANIDVVKAQLLKKSDEVMTFIRGAQAPKQLQERVKAYFEYLWDTRKTAQPAGALLRDLPPTLAVDVLLHMNKEILAKVDLFRNMDEIFIRDVVLLLEPLVFLPGDRIIRKGEYGDCMYFLTVGDAEVVVSADIVARLQEGSPFGEGALLSGETRAADVRALTFCDVFKLSRERFDSLRSKYPDFDARVRKIVLERQEMNKGR